MSDFNFFSEMVLGKKHLNILKFDHDRHNFVDEVSRIFNTNQLNRLHETKTNDYQLFKEFGKDSCTEFHKQFYSQLDSEAGASIKATYSGFIREVILPYLGLNTALVQTFPTFRMHMPGNVAVAKLHHDHELGHPVGEVNFLLSLTDMFDTNAVFVERMPRSESFQELRLSPNDCVSFNGNLCQHYNKVNETGVSRLSLDFRVLPLNFANVGRETMSVSTQKKFEDGGYYTLM